MALTVAVKRNRIKVTGTTAAAAAIVDFPVIIDGIYWDRPTSTAHVCSLTDGSAGIITMDDEGADQLHHFNGTRVDALYADDLDSGTLYIYYR